MRKATVKNVFPAPRTMTAQASSHSGIRETHSASTVMATAWATSAQIIDVRRANLADSAPAASPARKPETSRTAMTAPTPNAVPVTS
nr:hypothetical protein [Streptomyces albicerus]